MITNPVIKITTSQMLTLIISSQKCENNLESEVSCLHIEELSKYNNSSIHIMHQDYTKKIFNE